jgi:DNA (cytosine-5)-methyltransferase 1
MNVLALCSGIGGIELGLRLAEPSARTVCYVEREAYPLAVTLTRIREGHLDDAPVWSDVTTFDGTPWRGKVDCITGGYPCQPFSVAGHQQGADDPRHLWPDIRRIIGEVQPRFCFFENVANHLRVGFESVWRDLRDMGYTVEAGLFTAAEVGAPHKRQRLFILGDATQHRLQGGGTGRRQSPYPSPATPLFGRSGSDGALWPPTRDDADGWGKVRQSGEGLEPAICRMANGIPHRVDRIAALGNAVVPAVAAKAWQELRERIGVFKQNFTWVGHTILLAIFVAVLIRALEWLLL